MIRATTLFSIITLAVAQTVSAQAAPRMVSGRVFDDSTGCPLPGAQLLAGTGPAKAASDSHGRYRLMNPPADSFSLRATLTGYTPQQVDHVWVPDSLARVDFSLFRVYRDGSTAVAYPKARCQLEPKDSIRR